MRGQAACMLACTDGGGDGVRAAEQRDALAHLGGRRCTRRAHRLATAAVLAALRDEDVAVVWRVQRARAGGRLDEQRGRAIGAALRRVGHLGHRLAVAAVAAAATSAAAAAAAIAAAVAAAFKHGCVDRATRLRTSVWGRRRGACDMCVGGSGERCVAVLACPDGGGNDGVRAAEHAAPGSTQLASTPLPCASSLPAAALDDPASPAIDDAACAAATVASRLHERRGRSWEMEGGVSTERCESNGWPRPGQCAWVREAAQVRDDGRRSGLCDAQKRIRSRANASAGWGSSECGGYNRHRTWMVRLWVQQWKNGSKRAAAFAPMPKEQHGPRAARVSVATGKRRAQRTRLRIPTIPRAFAHAGWRSDHIASDLRLRRFSSKLYQLTPPLAFQFAHPLGDPAHRYDG